MDEEVKKILDAISIVCEKIDKLNEEKQLGYQSRDTQELNVALGKAYAEYPPINPNKINRYWANSYADYDSIMLIVRPILAKYGLSLTQRTIMVPDGSSYLETRLWHSSGQWIESRIKVVPSKNDYHTYGSALEFMKRTEAMDLLNVTISDNKYDDDAVKQQAQANEIFAKGTALNASYSTKDESAEFIGRDQLEELERVLQGYEDIASEVMDVLRIDSLANMPKSRYYSSLDRIHKIKKARDDYNIK
jgi:hypothetical protein